MGTTTTHLSCRKALRCMKDTCTSLMLEPTAFGCSQPVAVFKKSSVDTAQSRVASAHRRVLPPQMDAYMSRNMAASGCRHAAACTSGATMNSLASGNLSQCDCLLSRRTNVPIPCSCLSTGPQLGRRSTSNIKVWRSSFGCVRGQSKCRRYGSGTRAWRTRYAISKKAAACNPCP